MVNQHIKSWSKKVKALEKALSVRKQVEERLRESEESHRNLVETSQDLIFKCDSEGCFSYLNPAWEEVLGYKEEEMLGHKFAEFKTPEQTEKDLKSLFKQSSYYSINTLR